MVKSEDWSDGKWYLWYMEKNRSDMIQKISIFLDVFQKEGKIKKSDQWYFADKDWMDDLIIKNMKAKEHIITKEVQHDKKKIDFATNKNPLWPLSKDFSNELMDEIKEYPDYSNSRIDQELSDFLWVEKECVSVCQWSLDAIYNIPKCISFNDCVIVEPTYRWYAAAIENMWKKYTKFSMDKDFWLDIEKLSESIKDNTLVFLCNPNNPTGTYISHDSICELIKKHPKSHFIIDESHLLFNKEFDDMSMKKEVEKLPNLTVVISLSKFFNIPGIRMWTVISNPLIIDKFRMQNVPYYINNISSDILRKNIINKDGIFHMREKLFEVKNDFYEKLKWISRLDVKQNEYNNFFMCKINDENISARKLERVLAKQWIMIRLCEWIPGEWIRLSINTIENNDILIETLNNQEILTSCKKHSI